jgi:hypothetical protein
LPTFKSSVDKLLIDVDVREREGDGRVREQKVFDRRRVELALLGGVNPILTEVRGVDALVEETELRRTSNGACHCEEARETEKFWDTESDTEDPKPRGPRESSDNRVLLRLGNRALATKCEGNSLVRS